MCDTGQGLRVRGCGSVRVGLTPGGTVRKSGASRRPLESGTVDGDSPVGESS
jgi:hypothetical protein